MDVAEDRVLSSDVVMLVARRFGLGGGIALGAGFALAAAAWVWLLPETRGRRIG